MGTEQTNSQYFNPESEERRPKKIADLLTSDIPGIQQKNLLRLQNIDQGLLENGAEGGVLVILSTTDKSLRVLEKELGIGRHVLAKIYDFYGIPRRSHAEASAKVLEDIKKNPETAIKISKAASESMRRLHEDPETEEKRIAALTTSLRKPEARAKRSGIAKKMWQNRSLSDKESLARKIGETVSQRWQDPLIREKMIQAIRNSDLGQLQRQKSAENIRKIWANLEGIERFKLPTIQGFRRDIGYFAQSTWEANVARVLMFQKKEFYSRESFVLEVSDKHRDLFKFDITQLTVDFIVEENGDLVAYELLAHPMEKPVGIAKAEMFTQQYPNLKIHIIDEKEYQVMRKQFSSLINQSSDFCGWETSKNNLRNNPDKFGKI